MNIYTATIEHKYGTNLYHAKSEQGITDQVYGYVMEEWSSGLHGDSEIPEDRPQAIEMYFEDHHRDYLEYFTPIAIEDLPD